MILSFLGLPDYVGRFTRGRRRRRVPHYDWWLGIIRDFSRFHHFRVRWLNRFFRAGLLSSFRFFVRCRGRVQREIYNVGGVQGEVQGVYKEIQNTVKSKVYCQCNYTYFNTNSVSFQFNQTWTLRFVRIFFVLRK